MGFKELSLWNRFCQWRNQVWCLWRAFEALKSQDCGGVMLFKNHELNAIVMAYMDVVTGDKVMREQMELHAKRMASKV